MSPLPRYFPGTQRDQIAFFHDCADGDVNKVKAYVSTGKICKHWYNPGNGWTALHAAAAGGQVEVVQILLQEGFEKEALSFARLTPFDLIPATVRRKLRELLDFVGNERTMSLSGDSAASSGPSSSSPPSRRGSLCSDGFTPPFTDNVTIRRASHTNSCGRRPLPLSSLRSFSCDNSTAPGSPSSPSSLSSTYSYGRRDSLNRTRYILVRTSCGGGKESFTRVTLPGGSGVIQLKAVVEKALRGHGRVQSVFTLPAKELVEFDEQILSFAECQRIDVIFTDEDPSPEPVGDSSSVRRKSSCPEGVCPSVPSSVHPALAPRYVSMDIPATISESTPPRAEEAAKKVNVTADATVDGKVGEERAEQAPLKTSSVEIPPANGGESEEEEEEDEIVEKPKPLVFKRASTPRESLASERESTNGGFEEVTHDEVTEANTQEEEQKVEELEETKKNENEKKEDDKEPSPFLVFLKQHPHLVRNTSIVGVVGAVCAVAFIVMRQR